MPAGAAGGPAAAPRAASSVYIDFAVRSVYHHLLNPQKL